MDYINQRPDNLKIRQGDKCVIYISEHNRYMLKIEPDERLHTKFGVIHAMNLVGHPYGVQYDCKKGWVLPLRLTPELWTQLLPHRTQVLYQNDVSMILLHLDIKPGSVVVESGTGSGSLSHAIIRAIQPNGHLYTFDINEMRVQEAQREFIEHGLGDYVTVTHTDICESGFGSHLVGKVDACVLDIPQTWKAIEHAHQVLKPEGSRLCTFSPCIGQVEQNAKKMSDLKLKDISTLECLHIPYAVKTQNLRMWGEDVMMGLVDTDRRRYENIRNSLNPSRQAALTGTLPEIKSDIDMTKFGDSLKPLKDALSDPKAQFNPNMLPKSNRLILSQQAEIRSHTGFLTFARRGN